MNLKKVCNKLLEMVLMLFCAISILGISGYQITEINMIGGLLFVLTAVGFHFYGNARQSCDKADRRTVIISSGIFSVALMAGEIFSRADDAGRNVCLRAVDFIYMVGTFILAVILLTDALWWIRKQNLSGGAWKEKYKSRKMVFAIAGILIICWMPYFLTYFPGIFGSDPIESARQALGMEGWTNHHPVLYTAYMKLCLACFESLLGINGAMAVMTFGQMCVLGGALAYMLVWLMKREVPAVFIGFAFLFFAVNPVTGTFSVYATKDVLFSAMVVLFILRIMDFIREPEQYSASLNYIISMVILLFLLLFLRNNGIFIAAGTLVILAIIYRKYWKMFLVGLLWITVCMVVQKQVVFPLLAVEEGSFAESLSIPLQQIGQSLVDGGRVNEEQEQFLDTLLPIERWSEVYQPGYTDTIKFDVDFDDAYLNEHKGEFMKVWAGMLPANFGSYVKAYLFQTIGYWDMRQTESLGAYGVIDNTLGIRQTDVIKNCSGISLEKLIDPMILVCRKLPVLSLLTNMAVMVWLLGTVLLFGAVKRRKEVLGMIPLFWVWATIMIAAPAAVKFRYLFANYLAWPILLYTAWRLISRKEQ